jgi:signal transduction histidine kinase
VQESYVFRLSASAVAISLGFGMITGLLLLHLLTRRLQRLSRVMVSFQKSDFTRHEPVHNSPARAGDEVDRLGIAFDEMATRIIDQWGELKEQDRLRRQLVAQVSHDLRTPLAVLRGYLETLEMKGDELQPTLQAEYLTTALRQSERLTQMVEDLFDLAQLEARETQPRCEPMAIAELVQDVLQKFQLPAQQSQISLEFEPPREQPFVLADFALTERVLNNLISNALDHVPAGGRIRLEIDVMSPETVQISVTDTGKGIAEKDLPNLFEPFYRSEASHSGSGHAGLGLAIARRMVELQGGEISADNAPGGGARFRFTLQTAAL